jgi:hypothetical protein
MIREQEATQRTLNTVEIDSPFVVTGGGLSGVCCAITAAREGLKVLLIQDRPVLGGNASSEVRLWVLGATSHMGNNNRWAREGGVLDELLVENMYRNPEGNPLIFDSILLEKVTNEDNIRLLLNTAVYEVIKKDADTISGLTAFCSQNSTLYKITGELFCDASGDGIVGFLSGAAFRMGAESKEEFGEKFAPSKEYGELLGHSMYFYSKDAGRPVKFVAPSFALKDITEIPRFRSFNAHDYGCKLWWLEYGGRLDTVHDTEKIKWELWKVIYGVWDHIKNSGKFPESENLTLEWVGTIPGKRESRRFEGDYMLIQQDVVEQREHADAVAFGGWSIDLHPADGVFSEKPGCNQWHPKGIYQIPYRCLYSRNIKNLFLAGRIISASHVAFGSSRVMATSACVGQAAGMAAVVANRYKVLPAQIGTDVPVSELQLALTRVGHFIPGIAISDDQNLALTANLTASSELVIDEFPADSGSYQLDYSAGQMFPVRPGIINEMVLHAYSDAETSLEIELRISSKPGNHTPDRTLDTMTVALHSGRNCIPVKFDVAIEKAGYAFLIFKQNPLVRIPTSNKRVTGVLSVFNMINKAVSNFGKQEPTEDIGVDAFEFWIPQRRPAGENFALIFMDPIKVFGAENVLNGISRPTNQPNAWVSDPNDAQPSLLLKWDEPVQLSEICIDLDTDFDHPMESVLMGHPERVMPFVVPAVKIFDEENNLIAEMRDNHNTQWKIGLQKTITTRVLKIECERSLSGNVSVMAVRCY